MSPLAERVRVVIRRSRLLEAEDRVLVALSGGPDSVALTHVLCEIAAAGGLRLAGLAHFNHQLRGEASDEDERFCRALAARLGLPIDVGTAPVAALASRSGSSLEVAARDARYEFLASAADRLRASRIAVGHTLDDQAETSLLKLLRGAGPRGLAGIYPTRGRLVRPLLAEPRAAVVEYLAAEGLAYRQDESNARRDIPRNLIRHELLPWLRTHVNPAVAAALARGAAIAREDAEWLERTAAEAALDLVSARSGGATIDPDRLAAQPAALARRIARIALGSVRPDRFFGFDHVDGLLRLAAGPPGAALDLPGVRARRTREGVELERRSGRGRPRSREPLSRQTLSHSHEVAIPALGVAISVEWADSPPSWMRACAASQAVVDAEALHGGLAVRTRRAGDVVRPLGLGQRRKLQDVLVDRKVPRAQRDAVPLVVDADDRIVWVVGHVVAHDFRVTESTRGVIILTSRRL